MNEALIRVTAMAGLVVACALATAALLMLLRPWLQRHALARPNARSSHKVPTPQGAGIAVAGVTIAAVVIAAAIFPEFRPESPYVLMSLLAAVTVLTALGALDDFFTLEALPRIAVQLIAVSAVIAFLPADLRAAPFLPWWVERALLVVGLMWFINLVNFMDGLDWMTVAEVVPIAAGLVLIGTMGGLPSYGLVVALALGGAVLGFAPFNRPVASLFLGDAGSLPIGLILGWLLVLLAANGHWAAALLLPLYYLADATVTLLLRLRRGERVWQAHRSHFYQRATDGGRDILEIICHVFAVNIALLFLAMVTVFFTAFAVQLAALVVGGILVGWLLAAFANENRKPRPQ
jgi:UDP-N-acetylmuramyl pentapeptide phosphotransferase/UDP-N-acetylglucosamine-1-phosphate transferase